MAGKSKKNKLLAYFDEIVSVLDDKDFKDLVSSRRVRAAAAVALFIICLGINIHYRLYPAYFPQFKATARQIVNRKMIHDAVDRVRTMYPNYPVPVQDKIIDQTVNAWSRDKKRINLMVDKEYAALRDQYHDDAGHSYLLELDPYQWLRYTANVLRYGHPGDTIKGRISRDSYMLAPVGMDITYDHFLFYFSAFLYKVFTLFFPVTLAHFVFYLPLFFIFIYLSLVFYIAKKVFSFPAAFFTTLYIGLVGITMNRSCAGWYDYDILGFIMPLLIVWLIVCALKNKQNAGRLILYSFLASFFQGLYAFTWTGWLFIFVIICGFFVVSIINNFCLCCRADIPKRNKENLSYLLSAIIFISGSVVFCSLATGHGFFDAIVGPIKEGLHLGGSVSETIWPNTYYTVSELLPTNFHQIAGALYGKIIFILSLISVLYVYLKERRGEYKDFIYMMFLWFIFMIYVSLKSVRFIAFLSIPLGFFFGGFIWEMFKRFVVKLAFNARLKFAAITAVFVTSIIFVRIFSSVGEKAISGMVPMMNDDWYKALTYIKEHTPKNAIVNSWWDYGDLFKPFADRRVIFDGQSQNTPLAYWMAKAIMAQDEKYAVRILKMLNNASDTTFTFLEKYIPDQFERVAVLHKLLMMTRREGEYFLRKKGLPETAVKRVMADLHNKPVDAYFIVESTMISKMGSISLLGNWDFAKLYFYHNRNKPKNELIKEAMAMFGITEDMARAYYEQVSAVSGRQLYEILTRRYFFYNMPEEGRDTDGLVCFDNGLIYDRSRKKALQFSCQDKTYKVFDQVRFDDGPGVEDIFDCGNATINRSVGVFKEGGRYYSIFMDRGLTNSLYYRLCILKGSGAKYFTPFYMDDAAKIFVYRINWDVE